MVVPIYIPMAGAQERKKVKVKSLCHVRLFATPRTVAYQAPPSVGFSRQKCWSGMPFPSPDPHLSPHPHLYLLCLVFLMIAIWQPTPVFLPGESQGRGAW